MSILMSRQAMTEVKGNRRRTDTAGGRVRGGMENIHVTPSLRRGAIAYDQACSK